MEHDLSRKNSSPLCQRTHLRRLYLKSIAGLYVSAQQLQTGAQAISWATTTPPSQQNLPRGVPDCLFGPAYKGIPWPSPPPPPCTPAINGGISPLLLQPAKAKDHGEEARRRHGRAASPRTATGDDRRGTVTAGTAVRSPSTVQRDDVKMRARALSSPWTRMGRGTRACHSTLDECGRTTASPFYPIVCVQEIIISSHSRGSTAGCM